MKQQGTGFIVGSVGPFGNGVRYSMNNWKQFIFFVILVIACYQFLYFLSDMFLLGYINKYSWDLNFIQGTLNFLSIFLPYVFVRRIFRKTNQEKEDANN
jgi:putative lipoprotein